MVLNNIVKYTVGSISENPQLPVAFVATSFGTTSGNVAGLLMTVVYLVYLTFVKIC